MKSDSTLVLTVGHEETYDKGLEKAAASALEGHPRSYMKLGRSGDYPGGYAVNTVEDAVRLIKEQGRGAGWAVYEVDADWKKHTVPSQHGWWHALVKTSPILKKVNIPAPPGKVRA